MSLVTPDDDLPFMYYSDLEWVAEKYNISKWIYGHTHINVSHDVFVSNQYGSKNDRKKVMEYRKDFCIEI
jgi:hypothetical protein